MNLVLEPGLHTARERLGLFRLRDPEIPGNDSADFVRPPRAAQFPDGFENWADVPGDCEAGFFFIDVVTIRALSV